MFKLRTAAVLLAGALALVLAGCSAKEFNRQLEDTMGSMARTKVAAIGTPGRDCWLVKLNISKTYAIVLPGHILRLFDAYREVSVVAQFSGDGVDNAVLRCVQPDGNMQNLLLQLFPRNGLKLFRMDSFSSAPFTVGRNNGEHVLMQDAGNGMIRYWYVAPSDIRGPSLVSSSKVPSGKSARKSSVKSGKKSATSQPENVDLPISDLPSIQQDTSMKLETDTPPESAAPAPAARAEPVVVGKSKVSSGAAKAPASSGGATKPYTIVVD